MQGGPGAAQMQQLLTQSQGGTAASGAGGGFLSSLTDNPLFSAGAGMAGLGVGLAASRRLATMGLFLFKKFCTVSLEVPSKDRSYQWVLQYISKYSGRHTQHLGVETTFVQHSSGKIDAKFDFVPSTGQHMIYFKGRFISVERQREKTMIDINTGQPWENVTFSTFGRSRQVFFDLLKEARSMAIEKEEGKTIIYTSMGPEWRPFGRPRRKRPLHSVILPERLGEEITGDIHKFTRSMKWYLDRGIPYRRGYLLYGPPGCGKTSFIQALAGHLDYNICVLNLNERGLTDDKLNVLMTMVPPRSLVLLEDIDAAFIKRDPSMREYTITFSGLLNMLDGVASTEERIIFMTTNHIERLDPALIRPGRVDFKVEVGYADASQVRRMFQRFFPPTDTSPDLLQEKELQETEGSKMISDMEEAAGQGTATDNTEAQKPPPQVDENDDIDCEPVFEAEEMQRLADEFTVKYQAGMERAHNMKGLSVAEVQGYFIRFRDQPHLAVESVDAWLDELDYEDLLRREADRDLLAQPDQPVLPLYPTINVGRM